LQGEQAMKTTINTPKNPKFVAVALKTVGDKLYNRWVCKQCPGAAGECYRLLPLDQAPTNVCAIKP